MEPALHFATFYDTLNRCLSKPVYDDAMHVDAIVRDCSNIEVVYHNDIDHNKTPFIRALFTSPKYFKQIMRDDGGTYPKDRMSWDRATYEIRRMNNVTTKAFEKRLQHIKIYQLGPDEIERYTDRKLELVDTGSPTAFLESTGHNETVHGGSQTKHIASWIILPKETMMRWHAHLLGADALALYQASSPARATPIKFKDDKDGK